MINLNVFYRFLFYPNMDIMCDDCLLRILMFLDPKSLRLMHFVSKRFVEHIMTSSWNRLGEKYFPTFTSKINNYNDYIQINSIPLGIHYERNSGSFDDESESGTLLRGVRIRTFAVCNDNKHFLYVDENKCLHYQYIRGFLPYIFDDPIGPILSDVEDIILNISDCTVIRSNGDKYLLDMIRLKYDKCIDLNKCHNISHVRTGYHDDRIVISDNTMIVKANNHISQIKCESKFIYEDNHSCMTEDGKLYEYLDDEQEIGVTLQTSNYFVEMSKCNKIRKIFCDLAPGLTFDREIWYTVTN